jgi:sporulation protein YtfJ
MHFKLKNFAICKISYFIATCLNKAFQTCSYYYLEFKIIKAVKQMHPIENIMQTTMSEIRDMIDVNTVVGEAVITPDGNTIIPISKVCFGFVSGGGEYGDPLQKSDGATYPFAGGSGAGISISPVAFLVVSESNIKMMCVNHRNTYEKIIEAVPGFINELKNVFKGDDTTCES